MDLTLSDEQRLLGDSVTRFVAQRYDAAQRRRSLDAPQRCSADVWQSMAEFGWLALPLPQDDGGFGGGAREIAIVMEGLGKGLVLEPYLSSIVVGAGLIAAAGSAVQRARWLPGVAAGSARYMLAHGESMFESLGGPLACVASRHDSGWSITGSKCLVLDAPAADGFLVSALAQLSDGAALRLFLVPRDAPGLSMQPFETLDGRLAANLELSAVAVSEDHCLAHAEHMAGLIEKIHDRAIAALCAEAVGCMQFLLDATLAYTRTRVQFDKPIASNQVLRHRMVDMAIQCEEARAMALRAALHIDAAPALRAREVSGAKLKIARGARHVAENAIQLHGAMGVTEELTIGLYVKRLMSIEKTLGTPAEHQRRLSGLRVAQAH